MKRILFTLLCSICVVGASAQVDTTASGRSGEYYIMTLEDCLVYATGNNLTRRQMVLSEQSYRAGYDQAKLERLPSVSASASENLSHSKGRDVSYGGNYGIDAGMTLYQGGSITNTIKQNELQMERAAVNTAQYDNELTIQILQNFLSVLSSEELLKYQESLIEASREQVRQGNVKAREQSMLPSDYLLLEAQLASDLNNIENTRASRENALLALKALLSMDMDAQLTIIYPDTAAMEAMSRIPGLDYFVERSKATLPDLEVLRYAVEIAETNLKITKAAAYPSVNLSGGLGTGHSVNFRNFGTQLSDRFNQSAGVSLNIPIFSRGRNKANVTKGKIALEQARLDKQQVELDIHRTLIQEHRDVETALGDYNVSLIKENASWASFNAYNAQFDEGVITAVDLLQQKNNYISAMNDYVQKKYSFILKRKVLDVYMGLPVVM